MKSFVEVVKLSGSKLNHSPISAPESQAETHKNGVQPSLKFRPQVPQPRDSGLESSDESVASCLIPNENERFEVIKKPSNLKSLERVDSSALGAHKGSNVLIHSALKSDKLLPGQSSQSLLEQ